MCALLSIICESNIYIFFTAFSKAGGGRDMFASVGADGSVRMFDLRHLEHSTIIYEDPQHTPLLRLAWNKQDPNYLATVAMDACEVIILDVRVPCTPVARLNNHKACVNGIAWAPHSSCHICTAGMSHVLLKKSCAVYSVDLFNNKLTKNLSKFARFANKTLNKNFKFFEGLKSGTTYKNRKGPNKSSKYIDNKFFSIKYNLSLLFTIIYQFES